MSEEIVANEVAYEHELRSRLKQAMTSEDKAICRLVRLLDKRLGRQSATIYRLRCQLDEARALHSKIARGEMRRLELDNEVLLEWNHSVVAENRALREKLTPSGLTRAEEALHFDIPEDTPPDGVPSNENPDVRIHASDPNAHG